MEASETCQPNKFGMCEISIAPLHSPPSGQLKQVCKIMLYNRKKGRMKEERNKKKIYFQKREFSVFFIDCTSNNSSFFTHSSPFTFVLFKYCVSSQSIGFFHPTSRQND